MIMIWMVTVVTCWRLIHVKWQLQQSGGQNVCPTNQELQAALIMVSMLCQACCSLKLIIWGAVE